MNDRFEQLRRFLAEMDRLKHVQRRSVLIDGSRLENAAEHTWHACLFALVLHDELAASVDLLQALKMLVVHDIVEIDAGDTYAYDPAAREDQAARETAAAARLFALLPADRAQEFHALWGEFEAGQTPEARFARSIDRLQPLSLNVASGGKGWQRGRVRRQQVLEYNGEIHRADPALDRFYAHLIRLATEARMFADRDAPG